MAAFPTIFATPTKRAYAVFAVCVVSLVMAVMLQHVLGWQPCPLCVLQRLGILGIALFSLAAAITHKRPTLSRSMRGLASISAFGGGFAAYQQLKLLWGEGEATCGSLLRMYMTRLADTLPVLDWLLDGPADCAAEPNLLLGQPLAVWVIVLTVLCITILWQPARKQSK
jgi:disulfide bond formation protein DsbB